MLFLPCCSNQRTESIPRETFINFYIDLLIAGESGHLSSTDSVTAAAARHIIDSLYAKHGVTEIQVRQTLQEYNKDLKRWKDFYDEVTKRLEEMKQEKVSREQSQQEIR